ncbi:MAG: hypothetical protein PVI26_02025 [Chitinispirillia bacterium]|jgi:hypothetical protein
MENVYIQAFAALIDSGLYSSKKGFRPWDNDQDGSPLNIKRKQVYDRPYKGFGKLNAPDKLAFCVSALLFSDFSDINTGSTGICLANTLGSLSTDILFAESIVSGFPSPALFSATLPSSPVSDIAILFNLKGPNRVQVGPGYAGFSIIDSAIQLISFSKASSVLVVLVNAVEKEHAHSPVISGCADMSPYSFAFLLNDKISSSGINYKLNFTLSTNKNIDLLLNRDEKSYFIDIITALMNNEDHKCSFPVYGKIGIIKLIKEQ